MSWQDDQYFFWANNVNPLVALTPTAIHGIDHATGSVTGLQIGDQTGILPAMCTGLITAGTCVETQNCMWGQDHKNAFFGTTQYLFIACRPVTLGITRVAVPAVGMLVVWFSTVARTWIGGLIVEAHHHGIVTFPDGSVVSGGYFTVEGDPPVSGDSGSPIFLEEDGTFLGSFTGLDGEGRGFAGYAFPDDVQFQVPTPANSYSGSIYDYEEL